MATIIAGLDLGQTADYSALAVVERSWIPDPSRPERPDGTVNRFDLRHLHRWPLGTSYPAIVADLVDWFRTPVLRDGVLIVDSTGVGRPVVDMIQVSGILAAVHPYSITAGQKEGDGTVPKKDLVFAAIAALQTRRLRFAKGMKNVDVLEKELEAFRTKVTSDRNEVFSAREGQHDDLVLAVALAVWYGEKHGGGGYGTDYGDPLGHLPPGTVGNDLPADTFS